MRSRRRRSWPLAALALSSLLFATACSADRHARRDEPVARRDEPMTPTHQTRSGVPILMDIPVIGVLFRRTSTTR